MYSRSKTQSSPAESTEKNLQHGKQTWCSDLKETNGKIQFVDKLNPHLNEKSTQCCRFSCKALGQPDYWLQQIKVIPEYQRSANTGFYTEVVQDDMSAVQFVRIYMRQCGVMSAYVRMCLRVQVYLQTLQWVCFMAACGRNRACWVL